MRILRAAAVLALAPLLFGGARADVVHLKGGGALRGDVVRDDALPRDRLAVATPWGRVVVQRSRIDRVDSQPPAGDEYRRRAPTVGDDAASQFALARWCRDNGLSDEMRVHLTRVLALDPDHAEARRLLGYQNIHGKWMSREDVLAERGLVRHEGEFRTRQEIALLQRAAEAERNAREWDQRIGALRGRLGARDPAIARAAADELAALADPAAGAAIAKQVLRERDPAIQEMFVAAAARSGASVGLAAVARVALDDPNPAARRAAAEALGGARERGVQGLAAPLLAALGSRDNDQVNRAADALAALGDPATAPRLVNALVTTHLFQVGNPSGGETYSFNSGTGQYSFGGGGPKIVKQPMQNPRVLAALVELTGENFGYDRSAWREWMASRQVVEQVDLRRDP